MKEEKIRLIVEKYVDKRVIPGATYLVGKEEDVECVGYVGNSQIVPYERKIRDFLYYDLASLTKVLITAPIVMKLIELGEISLSDPVSRFFPETPEEKKGVTIFHLLTHTSGFYSYLKDLKGVTRENVIYRILTQPLEKAPGEGVTYSCINFVTLFYIAKKITGEEPYDLAKRWLYKPLGMEKITYTPLKKGIKREDIVPTVDDPQRGLIHGVVHDPLAAHLGGISGNAGLFSPVFDLYRYMRMILREGEGVFSRDTIYKMEENHTAKLGNSKGLGWDILENGLIGHTGYTGTSIYFSREQKRVAILLTNRVHPKDAHKDEMQILRREFHEEVFGKIY